MAIHGPIFHINSSLFIRRVHLDLLTASLDLQISKWGCKFETSKIFQKWYFILRSSLILPHLHLILKPNLSSLISVLSLSLNDENGTFIGRFRVPVIFRNVSPSGPMISTQSWGFSVTNFSKNKNIFVHFVDTGHVWILGAA